MYYFIEPPYLLLVFGLFIGVTSGLAFEAVLKEKGQKWFRNGSSEKILDEVQSLDIKLPFWGICAGICVFLAGGLEIFNFSRLVAYIVSLGLTLFVARLVWSQLIQVLLQLREGGSESIDLDIID
jgi:hypothetical protein